MLQINSVYFLTFILAVLPFISTESAQEQKLLPALQGRTTVELTWHFGALYIRRHPSCSSGLMLVQPSKFLFLMESSY